MLKNTVNLKSKALDFLSRRDYSYSELYNKLQKYSDDLDQIKFILDELVVRKFINEERFIENFIYSKSKKYGSVKVKYLLNNKVANKDLINQIYDEAQIDEFSLACQHLIRKFSSAPQDQKEKAKYFRFLQSRGFSSSIAIRAIEEAYKY